MRVKITEIRKKVEAAIRHNKNIYDGLNNDINDPQINAVMTRIDGQISALQAVREALHGDDYHLNMVVDGKL